MTIRELINELENFDDEAEITVYRGDFVYSVNNVKVRKVKTAFGSDKEYVTIGTDDFQIGRV